MGRPYRPTGKPPGRPRAESPGHKVSTWIRVDEYDRLYAAARQYDRSVSEQIARWLHAALKPPRSEP